MGNKKTKEVQTRQLTEVKYLSLVRMRNFIFLSKIRFILARDCGNIGEY